LQVTTNDLQQYRLKKTVMMFLKSHFSPTEEKELKDFIVNKQKLQHILIPLAHKEHAYIYQENYKTYEVSFERTRTVEKYTIERLKKTLIESDAQDRIKNYLAFLEISHKFF
jgi:hypothetical protein